MRVAIGETRELWLNVAARITSVLEMAIAFVNSCPLEGEGELPSVVYRIVQPEDGSAVRFSLNNFSAKPPC